MRYIIPINKISQPLIAGLNGGVEPLFDGQTYFIYDSDPNGENDIVSDRFVWGSGGLVDSATTIKPVRQFRIFNFLTFPKK